MTLYVLVNKDKINGVKIDQTIQQYRFIFLSLVKNYTYINKLMFYLCSLS